LEKLDEERALQKRRGVALAALCLVMYLASYLTRYSYSATMNVMIEEGVLTQDGGTLIGTLFFILYGVGQIFAGILGDRIRPERGILLGFVLTIACNLAMPAVSPRYGLLCAVWCFNGLAQSLFWPPVVRLFSLWFKKEAYRVAISGIYIASFVGVLLNYLCTSFLIAYASWQVLYYLVAGFAAAVMAVWIVFFSRPAFRTPARGETATPADPSLRPLPPTQKESVPHLFWRSGALFAVVAMIAGGLLKDGVQTWLPIVLTREFHASASLSSGLTAILPVFSILGIVFGAYFYRKILKNEMRGSFYALTAVAVLCGGLLLSLGRSMWTYILCSALIVGVTLVTNLMLLTYVPGRFSRYGCVATVSGLTDASSYLGSAFSSYGISRLIGEDHWEAGILFWAGLALLGGILCIAVEKRWRAYLRNERNQTEAEARQAQEAAAATEEPSAS
jgi:OPA family glycerol-3-phosphate transporter-like MFS transporter